MSLLRFKERRQRPSLSVEEMSICQTSICAQYLKTTILPQAWIPQSVPNKWSSKFIASSDEDLIITEHKLFPFWTVLNIRKSFLKLDKYTLSYNF